MYSSAERAESEPAHWVAPARNWVRPPPEPTGSYAILRAGLVAPMPAIQASMADAWAEEPAPAIEPDSGAATGAAAVVAAGAADEVLVVSFEAEQAESSSVSAAAEATAPERSAMFTDCPIVLTHPDVCRSRLTLRTQGNEADSVP